MLQYYAYVNNYTVSELFLAKEEEKKKDSFVLADAVPITLSQYNRTTSDIITAHRVKDYRQKKFKLQLLPQVRILLDEVIERR